MNIMCDTELNTEIESKRPVEKPEPVPLIAHIIYRLDVGGLENGLVNLINASEAGRYQHAIICLTEYTDFKQRILRDDVQFYALHKREGIDFGMYLKLWRLLCELRPDIVHTRNLAAMEGLAPALFAGVKFRIHGEHGREMDLNGSEWKYNFLRRLFRPLVHKYIPLSQDLESWLRKDVHVSGSKIAQIYNGVSIDTFYPSQMGRQSLPIDGFADANSIVIGTVGRMASIKDQSTLAAAFVNLIDSVPNGRESLRLVMVGDGPLREDVQRILSVANVSHLAWIPGTQDDIPHLLRCLDIFVLPSKSEGVSNTILEAMATGLPVVATRVGGNPELVVEQVTGELVPPQDPLALANALRTYVDNPQKIIDQGRAGRKRVEEKFSIDSMVNAYLAVYDSIIH